MSHLHSISLYNHCTIALPFSAFNFCYSGYFKTELNRALVDDKAFSDWLIGRTPSRRWGELEDLVGAAIFLASDASNFVNGQIIYVDGGVTASL